MLALNLIIALAAPATYADPGGAFALDIPSGWKTNRMEFDTGVFYTEIYDPNKEDGAHIDVLVQQSGTDIEASQHAEVNKIMVESVIGFLTDDGTVTKQTFSQVTLSGKSGTKAVIEFKDDEGTTFAGSITAICGRRNAVAVISYALAKDANGLKTADQHASTFAIESKTPNKAGASTTGGILDQKSLSSIAGKVKGNLKRSSSTTKLADGTPPLTYGSVANFVNVIEILFDIQLTEAEFEATQERFIEYCQKADAEGKKILAEQGAGLLETLTTGTPQEREQSRAEGKAVFENAFKNGAEMGIGYAQVMWDAITRRSTTLGTSKKAASKDGYDQEISEGDIDATMEMLYFMWVAAGRDASDVTMDDIIKIRTEIIQSLPQLDPQLQYLIANAPKVYAGIRQKWQSAKMEQRLLMAQQFSAALDEWGIGAQSSFEQSGGGGGGSSDYSMNAQIAQNTAWNAAKTW